MFLPSFTAAMSILFSIVSQHSLIIKDICVWTRRQWTLLQIVKDQSSLLMYLNICTKHKPVKIRAQYWSSKLRDNNTRKNHPCHTKLCAFWCLISRLHILNLRYRNQIRGKFILSRKLRHFKGSNLSQWFLPSTSHHYSFNVRFHANLSSYQ